MGFFGLVALLATSVVAGLTLWRAVGSVAENTETNRANWLSKAIFGLKTETLVKVVAWLALATALFAAKLFPVAAMVIVAAAAVTGIEVWRERMIKSETGGAGENGVGNTNPTPRLSRDEAADVLGISASAEEHDIIAAHKRLITRLHPDQGGSDFLASQINSARDTLLDGLKDPTNDTDHSP
ncbi:MAG: hypothetical protein AAF742_03815 [Pseudomonadota bacterium]